MVGWPSGLRRNVKVSLIHKLLASVVFGRGFESHSCHTFFVGSILGSTHAAAMKSLRVDAHSTQIGF